ncbi:MAG: hypothetical protein ACR2H5_20145, partial [Ktedonobacteraceae bacterium]
MFKNRVIEKVILKNCLKFKRTVSIAQVNQQLKQLFEHDAPELAKQMGMRERTISFAQLALLFVMGWWSQPHSGPSALARFAGSLGLTVSKQAVDCHW